MIESLDDIDTEVEQDMVDESERLSMRDGSAKLNPN